MRKLLARRPSPALVVSITALLVALGGTSYAALGIPKNSVGTKQLKSGAVKSKNIANGAVTSSKINTNGLTVPNAINATNATNATNAANATSATNAAQLGGAPPSAYLPASKVLRWSFAMNKGDAPHSIEGFGPLTFTAMCAADAAKTDAKLSVSTSEAGTFVSNNPGALPGPFTLINPGDAPFTVVEQDSATANDGNSGYFVGFDAQNTLAVFSTEQTIGLAINTAGADCRFFGYLVNDA